MSKKYPKEDWITADRAFALKEGEVVTMVYEDEIFWAVQRTPDLDRPLWKGKKLGWYITDEVKANESFALEIYDRLFDTKLRVVTYSGESLLDPTDRKSFTTTADFSNARTAFGERLRVLPQGTAILALGGTPKRILLGVKRYDGSWSVLDEQRWISDEEALELDLFGDAGFGLSSAMLPPTDSYPTVS